jgi:hypothetical protein
VALQFRVSTTSLSCSMVRTDIRLIKKRLGIDNGGSEVR